MGFPRQKYWSRFPFPPPGNLPVPGIELVSPASPALAGRFFTVEPAGKSSYHTPLLCTLLMFSFPELVQTQVISPPTLPLYPFPFSSCLLPFLFFFFHFITDNPVFNSWLTTEHRPSNQNISSRAAYK